MKAVICPTLFLLLLAVPAAQAETLKVQINAPGVEGCTLQYQFLDSDTGELVPGEESYISRDIELTKGIATFDIEVGYEFEYVRGKISLEKGGFVSLFNLTFTSRFSNKPVLHNYASSLSSQGKIEKRVFNFLVPCNLDFW